MQIRIMIILCLLVPCFAITVAGETPLKAAFIREGQLWIVDGNKETQVTKDKHVSSPKWSKDGRFLAYLNEEENGEKRYLFLYDTIKKENYQPYERIETTQFQWSPTENILAYNVSGVLNRTKTKNGRPDGFENIALGVSDFAWFPNGKEFIASAQSNLLPSGWEPVQLFRIAADANLNPKSIKSFYTLPANTDEFFAINAEYFKWSADGKWVSFLATPTASWSMDSNTLSVLTTTGHAFQAVGKMLFREDWYKWAPTKNQLAFISGEGRFYVENKKTAIVDLPAQSTLKEYTPKGYVDLGLDWYGDQMVVVARAKENKAWKEGPVPTMFTKLYSIDITSGEQVEITSPKGKEWDSEPKIINEYITWFRKSENEHTGNAWIMKGLHGKNTPWIKNIDSAPEIYHK